MAPDPGVLKALGNVTLQLLTTCNLSCDYCFQDACNVSACPQGEDRETMTPDNAARAVISFFQAGKAELGIVFSGGEPLLAPVAWYESFFRIMDRYLRESGKKADYSIQTNLSILKSAIIDLFRRHDVHFSVHYDGELDDPKLLSGKRKENIITLFENGFQLTALVVGTVASLKVLPSTIDFFHKHGVRFYRLNCVSSQGRGYQVSRIPPKLRAEAEFESAFLASQYDFGTRDNVVMNKFLFYYNNVLCGKEYNRKPHPQKCLAGVASAYIAADGFVYPCSFFTQITGPMAKTTDLPLPLERAAKAVALCETPNPYYDTKCIDCSALPICGEYCALSPVTDTDCIESFCNAQVTLRGLMDDNREIAALIAKRFIEHKRKYPGDIPRSCGTRS